MTAFQIMQEAGAQAVARRERLVGQGYDVSRSVRPKNVGLAEGREAPEALEAYVQARYIATGNAQYRGHRLQWTGSGASGATWREDDGQRRRGRRWRLVVKLANGSYEHDVHLEAWPSPVRLAAWDA